LGGTGVAGTNSMPPKSNLLNNVKARFKGL